MALSIDLTGGGKSTYSPGDLLCGVIRLQSKNDHEPCEALYITLQGLVRVSVRQYSYDMVGGKVNSSVSSHSFLIRRSILVARTTDFQSGGGGDHCWPFSFVIPSQVDPGIAYDGASGGALYEAESPFKGSVDDGFHPLPPSMSHYTQSEGLSCAIEYSLLARLVRPPSLLLAQPSKQNLRAVQVVNLQPRSSQPRASAYSATQTLQLASSLANKSAVLKKLLRIHRSSIDANPKSLPSTPITVSLNVSLPGTIDLQDASPVPITLKASYAGCDRLGPQQVHIKKFSIQINVCTKVRWSTQRETQDTVLPLYAGNFDLPITHDDTAPPSTSPSSRKAAALITTTADHGADGVNAEYSPTTLETQIGTLIRQALHRSREPMFVPEFATYSIFRAYSLRLRVKMRAFGQGFVFQRCGIPLSILTTYPASGVEYSSREDSPPSYCREVVGNGGGIVGDTMHSLAPVVNSGVQTVEVALQERCEEIQEQLPAYSRRQRCVPRI